jgi:hypothetical protein
MALQGGLNILLRSMSSQQEILIFLTRNFSEKNPPYGFFAPMSNLTKVPFWTSGFGPDHFD